MLQRRQLVLSIEENSATEEAILPAEKEVCVAIDEGGELGVSSGVIIDFRAMSAIAIVSVKVGSLRCRRFGLPSSFRNGSTVVGGCAASFTGAVESFCLVWYPNRFA